MKRLLVILLASLALFACVRSVDGYNSDPHVAAALSAYSGTKISVTDFESALGAGGVSQCRGYNIITTSGESGLVRYIQDAFISELELANAYSPDSPIVIGGKVTQISLSTLTVGEWIIKITLTSNNGRSISAREQLHFKANIVGQSACQVASDTFSYAVQNIIRRLATSPNFRLLLEPSNFPKIQPPRNQQLENQSGSQPVSVKTAPLEISTYSQPVSDEIVPLEVTTQSEK